MNQNQLKAIIEFRSISDNPEIIPERLEEIRSDAGCIRFINGCCDDCQACEILEVLENPEDY